jgi:hypothetical protein
MRIGRYEESKEKDKNSPGEQERQKNTNPKGVDTVDSGGGV